MSDERILFPAQLYIPLAQPPGIWWLLHAEARYQQNHEGNDVQARAYRYMLSL
jgi:hypothetical protein